MNPNHRGPSIVVIDEDVHLIPRISGALTALGCSLEAVADSMAFTSELIGLSEPHVVLVNPRFGNIDETEIINVIAQVKSRTRARVVVLSREGLEHALMTAKRLKADGGLFYEDLISSPAEHIAHAAKLPVLAKAAREMTRTLPHAIPEYVPFESPGSRAARPPVIAAEKILGLELTESAPLAHQRVTDALPKPRRNSELLQMIEEALDGFEDGGSLQTEFVADIDLVSDHNFYAAGPGISSGLFVWTVVLPRVGSVVSVKLGFPWGEYVELKMKVVWCKDGNSMTTNRRGLRGFGAIPPASALLQRAFERFSKLRHPMLLGD
jgi:CheY-like chemotaxis protein